MSPGILLTNLPFSVSLWLTRILQRHGQSIDLLQRHSDHREKRSDLHKVADGFVILPDGSLIFSYDQGVSLQRFDACSNRIWARLGKYHHNIELTDDKSQVWTLRRLDRSEIVGEYDYSMSSTLELINVSDGSIAKRISIWDVIQANPNLDILGIRQTTESEFGYEWADDPFHGNDVDPLPADLADKFPLFSTGDLLVSLRSLNLVFVLNPGTLRIKWFTMGLTRRQHDPDWQPDGTITIFDNNMHRNASSILRIDPETRDRKIVLDGRDIQFYTWRRGKHQITSSGNILVTSSEEGRIFEASPDGIILFEFINKFKNQTDKRLQVSEVKRLDNDYFYQGVFSKCAQ